MSYGRELSKGPREADRGWLSWRQFAGVVVFVALFAGLVVWTTVAMPSPVAYLVAEVRVPANVEVRTRAGVRPPAAPSPASTADRRAPTREEAP